MTDTDTTIQNTYLGCADCGGKVHSRGLCMTHYQQARRGGYLNDYPPQALYQRDYAEDTIRQIVERHGADVVQDVLDEIRATNPPPS